MEQDVEKLLKQYRIKLCEDKKRLQMNPFVCQQNLTEATDTNSIKFKNVETISQEKEINTTNESKYENLSKTEKENQNEMAFRNKKSNIKKSMNVVEKNKFNGKEELSSDIFYSYFPSYNESNKYRNKLIKERHNEYQNYLLEVSKESNKSPNSSIRVSNKSTPKKNIDELEIIVNNPYYSVNNIIEKLNSPRPGSSKYKHLEDLKHTELNDILSGDAIIERNRQIEEEKIKKQKQYQKELMTQIEEKKKYLAQFKEKEKQDEKLSARKLCKQLDSISLFNRNEEDAVHISKVKNSDTNKNIDKKLVDNDKCKEMNSKNRVYKYFSNSAKRDKQLTNQDFQESSDSENSLSSLSLSISSAASCQMEESKISIQNQESERISSNDSKKSYSPCKRHDDFTTCIFCLKTICLDCTHNFCTHCGRSFRKLKSNSSSNNHLNDTKQISTDAFQVLDVSYGNCNKETEQILNNNSLQNNTVFQTKNGQLKSVEPNNDSIIVHNLDKNNESFEEIKKKTNERLSRYIKNYGDLPSRNKQNNLTKKT